MRCPRCGSDNERDVSKTPCSRCGLLVRMPERSTSHNRLVSPRPPQQKMLDGRSNPFLTRLNDVPQDTPMMRANLPTTDTPTSLTWQPNIIRKTTTGVYGIPHRPHLPFHAPETTGNQLVDMEQAARSLRLYPSEQMVTSSDVKDELVDSLASFSIRDISLQDGVMLARSSSLLMPGTLLRNGRYRLQENRDIQEWLKGVYEATWIAQDAQRAGMQVVICELSLPDDVALPVQTMLRQATIALTSIGRHPHVPTLWDAFSEQGEHFFVFEPVQGETLLERMRRTGRAFPEQHVVEMALQILDVIDSASQQMPSLVHGLIRPEHIFMNNAETEFVLTNFSVVLAGRATQLVEDIDSIQPSPYFSLEFVQGKADIRSDMYALVATMYHAVTGSLPDAINDTIPEAQRLNPTISSAMNAFLAKGLHPRVEQRFQRLTELRQAIDSLHQANGEALRTGTIISGTQHSLSQPAPSHISSITSQVSTGVSPKPNGDARVGNSQELHPFKIESIPLDDGRATNRFALIFIIGIVVCLLVLLALWRFLLY